MDQNINTNNLVPQDLTSKLNAISANKSKYDPILDDLIGNKSSSEDSSNSDASSEEEIQIEFPRQNAADLMTFLHREITNIQNLEDA